MHRNRQRFQFTRSICSVVDFFSLLARSLAVAFIWFFSPKPLLNERDLKSINAIIWVLVIDRIYLLLPFPAKNRWDYWVGCAPRTHNQLLISFGVSSLGGARIALAGVIGCLPPTHIFAFRVFPFCATLRRVNGKRWKVLMRLRFTCASINGFVWAPLSL